MLVPFNTVFFSIPAGEGWRYPVVSILSQFNDQLPVSSVTSADYQVMNKISLVITNCCPVSLYYGPRALLLYFLLWIENKHLINLIREMSLGPYSLMLIAMWVSCWAICQSKLSCWFLLNKYLPTFSYQCQGRKYGPSQISVPTQVCSTETPP